jgi:MFS transporter, AAHS family, 4-hydroxybenzoate transporter
MPWATAICMTAVLIIDAFDLVLLGYLAPDVATSLAISRAQVGVILTISLIGAALGGLSGGYLGDRWGRRPTILSCLALFGGATLVSASTASLSVFMASRFLAGLGLGTAAPNTAALLSEVLPAAWRSQTIVASYALSGTGTVLAGVVARWLLPTGGWRECFMVGGVVPLILWPLLYFIIPESPALLEARRQRAAASPALLLFSPGYLRDTLALWILVATNQFATVANANWGTTVIGSLGYPLPQAVNVMTGFNLAGVLGALATGVAMRRFGSRRTFVVLATSAMAVALWLALALRAGVASPISLSALRVCVVISGAALVSLLQASYPVAAHIYPTRVRASSIGWAAGFGRLGAISSSMAGVFFLAHGGPYTFYLGMACASLVTLAATLALNRHIAPWRGAR